MSVKKSLKNRLRKPFFGIVFAAILSVACLFSPAFSQPAFADSGGAKSAETCYDQVEAIGWLVCPSTGVLGKAVDAIYGQIEKLLVVNPVALDNDSPMYQVWQVMRDITNIVFVIMLLIVVYSQITGLGISNYGIKAVLPKLVIAAILVNLSYIICALAVDVSNIVGASLKDVFTNIESSISVSGELGAAPQLTWTDLTAALISGGAVGGLAIGLAGGLGSFLWPLLMALIGGIIAVLIGLITIGMRQALIAVLIMVAPLAFIAYLLPNTENWFKKWKDIFISMLVFYPMFSLLFGASQLAGWAIIANSLDGESTFGVILGMAVKVFPLIMAIPMLKMSSTVLGAVSSKLSNLGNKALSPAKEFAGSKAQLARSRHIAESMLPSAGLRRYLDGRQRKRELDIENVEKHRKALAEIYAQKKLVGGNYDPADGKHQKNLRANASTRSAKSAMNAALAAEYAKKDTAHLLDQYGDYYDSTKRDQALSHQAGKNYLEFYRTMLAEENDAYADQDWVMGQYNKMRSNYDPSKPTKKAAYNYNHYIVGAAGALGQQGAHTVLGEVISRSAMNEAKRRSYTKYTLAKYGYNKRDARNMMVGYYNDDDGFAANPDGSRFKYTWTDKTGQHTVEERSPGEFLKYHPEWLKEIAYDKYDKDADGTRHYYYDARDQEGKFIARIYKDDTSAMKEILSDWDMNIADPIDGLYGILSGIKDGKNGDYAKYDLQGVGLAQLSTTLNRATMSSGYKEKASFAGPMYATSVGQRYIKDMVHLNLARLDNLIKTAKPSGFNTQDAAELHQLKLLMNPENWDWMLFDYDSLMSFKNVNGNPMKGTRFIRDKDGNIIDMQTIAHDDPSLTLEDLKNTVIKKYLIPAAPKFTNMMSRITNGIIDNQKPGGAANWVGLLDSMEAWNDPKWKKKYPQLIDPFAKQSDDTIYRAKQVSRRIRPVEGNRPSPALRKRMQEAAQRANGGIDDEWKPYKLTEEDKRVDREFAKEWGAYQDDEETKENENFVPSQDIENTDNDFIRIDLMAAENSTSPDFFFDDVRRYLDEKLTTDIRYANVIDQVEEYITFHGQDASISVEEHAAAIKEIVLGFTYED